MQKEKTKLEISCETLSLSIIEWYKTAVKNEYSMKDIYNQLLRSATSVGANVAEAKFPQSDADYKSKMNIALKEASETRYWLGLLKQSQIIDEDFYNQLITEIEKIISILYSLTNKNKQ